MLKDYWRPGCEPDDDVRDMAEIIAESCARGVMPVVAPTQKQLAKLDFLYANRLKAGMEANTPPTMEYATESLYIMHVLIGMDDRGCTDCVRAVERVVLPLSPHDAAKAIGAGLRDARKICGR